MRAFLIALQFLSSLPVRLSVPPEPKELGRSVLCYPLVGVLFGLLLCLAAGLLGNAPAFLQAALLLTLWVGLSGALHLDGLADSADAWLGGLGDRERTLAIMKDPRSGPLAVVVLFLLLLLKWSALVLLLQRQQWLALLLAPMLGRAWLVVLFLTTPYVRRGGLGEALAQYLPRHAAIWVLAFAAVCVGALSGASGGGLLLLLAALFYGLRHALVQRLGGTTGDTAGAVLEIVECVVLLWYALVG